MAQQLNVIDIKPVPPEFCNPIIFTLVLMVQDAELAFGLKPCVCLPALFRLAGFHFRDGRSGVQANAAEYTDNYAKQLNEWENARGRNETVARIHLHRRGGVVLDSSYLT